MSCKSTALNWERVGNLNPNWKGGISTDNMRYRRLAMERHPEHEKARKASAAAIRSGKLIPQPCEMCGSLHVCGHHDDYSKPLDVRWLCREHHSFVHGGHGVGGRARYVHAV